MEWPPGFGLSLEDLPLVLATVHPSSILRAPEGADRKALMAGLVNDLRVVADTLR